jgi:AraC-like DNA-binding protein
VIPRKADGFEGEILHAMPADVAHWIDAHPLLSTLAPSDAGYFPTARFHYRKRPRGANQHILIYCAEGKGWCEAGGRQRSIEKGEALFLPARLAHAYGADAKEPWSIYWAHFTGTHAPFYLNAVPSAPRTLHVQESIAAETTSAFARLLDALALGFGQRPVAYAAHVLRYILGLLIYAAPDAAPDRDIVKPVSPITQAIHYMSRRLDRPPCLDDLAKQVGLSPSRFAHRFKQQTGYAPIDYLARMRVQRACQLLLTTSWPVQAVAQQLGFTDPYYFSRVFRRIMGTPPSTYRRRFLG